MIFASSVIDWAALWQVVYISAIFGILIATVLGAGIVASLKASDDQAAGRGGSVFLLRGATAVSVILVAAAVAAGIYYITDKS